MDGSANSRLRSGGVARLLGSGRSASIPRTSSWNEPPDVASFGQLPHPVGTGAVVALDPSGSHEVVVSGLTLVIDVGFDRDGSMLVLEYARPADEPAGTDAYRSGTGRLLHLAPPFDGSPRVLVDDLARPTALTATDDAVFVSLSVGEEAREEGSVVRFDRAELDGLSDQ